MDYKPRNDWLVDIGLNIAQQRKREGLSQEELAEMAGISRQWLAEIEASKLVTVFSLDTLFALASALNTEPWKLLIQNR